MQNESTPPLVSVIVPVYHVENELRRCLDSLLRQSFQDFEILLINDGGNAAETEICEEYARSDPRIVYRRQDNQGLSVARNAGLSLARGSWIMFVDSDDWVSADFVQSALNAVSENVRMVIFDLLYKTPDGKDIGLHRSGLETGLYPPDTVLRARILGQVTCYAWNKLYARSLWDGISFPVGELWEDDAVIHELIDRAGRIAVIHDVLYYKTDRPDSITGIAFQTDDQYRWLFIQRRRRYFFLRERYPELMAIESRNVAAAALQYAESLAIKNRPQEMRAISVWLRGQKLSSGSMRPRLRLAVFLLKYSPSLFFLAAWIRKALKACVSRG